MYELLQRKQPVTVAVCQPQIKTRVRLQLGLKASVSASSSQHRDWTRAGRRGDAPLRTVTDSKNF